jgi:hypothetical protein
MQGKLIGKTLLTARLYEPKDKSLGTDFLRAHPVTSHPELYKEVKGGRRKVKNRVVQDDFVELLVDCLQSAESAFSDFKYHHSGTGTDAEAADDGALGTPVEDARDVGTQTETSSKVYKSVATTTYTDTHAITEHGLFNTAGAGDPPTGGVMMDRSKFDAINVVDGNQIEWKYELSVESGG